MELRTRPVVLLVVTLIYTMSLFCFTNSFFVDDPTGSGTLHVGSFNAQGFTVDKSRRRDVLKVTSRIIQRYDVMLMLEIEDDAQHTAMNNLWTEVNRTMAFGLSLSKPLGRNLNAHSESYGFFYRLDTVSLTGIYQYNDSNLNVFEREPYAASFRPLNPPGSKTTPLIAIHIASQDTVTEMSHMVEVVKSVMTHFSTDRVVVLGDLNADCSYISSSDLAKTPLHEKNFTWVIPDSADTTETGSFCAFDRIILTNNVGYKNPRVFDFDREFGLTYGEAAAVSDHYPVETYLVGL